MISAVFSARVQVKYLGTKSDISSLEFLLFWLKNLINGGLYLEDATLSRHVSQIYVSILEKLCIK